MASRFRHGFWLISMLLVAVLAACSFGPEGEAKSVIRAFYQTIEDSNISKHMEIMHPENPKFEEYRTNRQVWLDARRAMKFRYKVVSFRFVTLSHNDANAAVVVRIGMDGTSSKSDADVTNTFVLKKYGGKWKVWEQPN